MTDKKITDEEIKSSLEVIATTRNCNECKIRNCKWGTCNCSQITANAALDLINRQKAELEAIKDEKAVVFKLSEEQINEIKEQINETKEDLLKSVEYNVRNIKAEAYKEFVQKAAIELTNAYSSEYAHWIDDTLNNLLEKLIGDNK